MLCDGEAVVVDGVGVVVVVVVVGGDGGVGYAVVAPETRTCCGYGETTCCPNRKVVGPAKRSRGLMPCQRLGK